MILVAVADTTEKNFDLRWSSAGFRVQLLGTSFQLAAQPVDLSTVSERLLLGVEGTEQTIAQVRASGAGISFTRRTRSKGSPLFSSVKVVGVDLTLQPELPKGCFNPLIGGSH